MKRRDLFGKAFQQAPLAGVRLVRWDDALRVRIARLPLMLARADAQRELARGRLFRATRGFLSEDDRARVAPLEPECRALVERWRAIETNAVTLAVHLVAPHAVPGLYRIGTDSALGVILAGESDAAVWIAPERATEARAGDAMPSIWHYLLYVRERPDPI